MSCVCCEGSFASFSNKGGRKMIHAILIINNHGKPRLTKFYDAFVCLPFPYLSLPFPLPFFLPFFLPFLFILFPPSLSTLSTLSILSPLSLQDETKQQAILRETYQHISRRSDYQCNFLEVQIDGANGVWDKDIKLIYRFVLLFLLLVFCD